MSNATLLIYIHTRALFVIYAHVLTCAYILLHLTWIEYGGHKKDVFRDMGTKLKIWRHSLKSKLDIQDDDTPKTIKVRIGQIFLDCYDSLDLEVLLDKWCEKKNRVGHDRVILLFCIVSLIIIMLELMHYEY
jgi:hypothetical protein